MEAAELFKKIRKIEIKTRGLSRQVFAGEYHSAFKGRGIAFSEVREYQYGDDIRTIDWNVTARFNHPYVKVFEEERELTVMLVVDVSGSRNFGSGNQLKKNLITELSAVLSFSAIQNNDKIGVILFSDHVEKFIPPKKGRQHILRIIRELIEFQPGHQGTNISEALRYLTNAIKKRSIAFIISDFFDQDFEKAVRVANNKHDIVALKIYDVRETDIPPVGLIKMKDAESGKSMWVNTNKRNFRLSYKKWWEDKRDSILQTLSKCGVDHVELMTDKDYVAPLVNLFKRRSL